MSDSLDARVFETIAADLPATDRASAQIYREFLAPHRNCLLLLEGELGAGKTAFVHGLGPTLGIDANINSPTFNLLNVYENPRRAPEARDLYHYDLYRLMDPGELDDLDFVERWSESPADDQPARLHAIEWWQRAGDQIPRGVPRFRLTLDILEPEPGPAPEDLQESQEPRRLRLYRLP
ncbi:MAG: tRNA (adenosine(37)-N6)-threonylcarbamoyltransferase complex ATPase subunit type 1 TsaE [bacterium]|nr:tRNA (adenosine(37)-N6)-threonylcarbamoyltransferase complex ATPase subunit type 1 TsaE [bacterium]